MTTNFSQHRLFSPIIAACLFCFFSSNLGRAQQVNPASVIQQVDAAVHARIESVLGYTVTEHYAVFRSNDEIHPAAEMAVQTTYQKDSGKSYSIISQTGSAMLRNVVLAAILDNEKRLNQPDIRQGAWITSANYTMNLKPGGAQPLGERSCFVLDLIPKRKAPYLIHGVLWVDVKDGSIVQVQGSGAANSSVFSGPAQIMRQYANIDGYPEATHVRAVSNSFMFGRTVVTIDYQNYQIQLRPHE
jgi:hypothetical protein